MAAARRRAPDPGRLLGRGDDDLPGPREPAITEAAAAQAAAIPYAYNHHFTNRPQELLADRLVALAPPMARVKLTSGGSEANEAALRLARELPHRARRRRPLAGDLAGSGLPRRDHGRPGAERPAAPCSARTATTWRPTCTCRRAAGASTRPARALSTISTRSSPRQEPETVAAVFCEPVGGAALPGHVPPDRFWAGPGGTSRPVRIPRLLRRGRQRGRPDRQLARGRAASDRARHRHDRQEPRRGPRSGRGDAVQRPGLRGDRGREPRVRPRSHLGRRAPAVRGRPRGGRRDRRHEA